MRSWRYCERRRRIERKNDLSFLDLRTQLDGQGKRIDALRGYL